MNSKLNSALAELKKSGAKGIPTVSVIEAALDGTSWSGDGWELTKNHAESYSCMTGK